MRIFRAISILLAHLLLLILGMPGLDFLPPTFLQSEQTQEAMKKAYGDLTTQIATAASDLNRSRLSLEKRIGKIQPIFRVSQSWHLYRDGPQPIRKLEIQVDGVPVSRTLDSRLDWMESTLRTRRIRPVVESVASKPKAANRKGLARFIVDQARADFPKIRRVDIISMSGRRPGDRLERKHRFVARSPEWKLEEQK